MTNIFKTRFKSLISSIKRNKSVYIQSILTYSLIIRVALQIIN